uniref:ribonuclease pancreatic-like n=1 Tax=Euleptes europaea TaxID=460621 RepID=UPI00254221CF|nr:ribonuclease pancreatic-like [Euleptes europaea]
MLPKGPLLSCLLLFSILFLVSSVDASLADYQSFLRRHVDPRRTTLNPHIYCQRIMREKSLTSPTCTRKNTFIHTRNSQLKVICGVGGMHYNSSLSDSLVSYLITTCYSMGGTPPALCRYRGSSERRRIRVNCFKGIPVRLREILIARP